MKKPSILFAVAPRSHTGSILKPSRHNVIGGGNSIVRIVLATNLEEAVFLTYPKLHLEKWGTKHLKAYFLNVKSIHPIKSPTYLKRNFEHPLAEDHGEYACFSNLRMEYGGLISIRRNSKHNKDLLDVNGSYYGKHYAIY